MRPITPIECDVNLRLLPAGPSHLSDIIEAADESGDIDASKRTMVSLGPHLANRVDLVCNIGGLLKRFEQEEVMRRMIEAAQRQYPDSPEVAKAAQHLLA